MSISLAFSVLSRGNKFEMIGMDTYNIFTEMVPFHSFRWLAYQKMMSAYFLLLITIVKISIALSFMINAASPKPAAIGLFDMLKKPFFNGHIRRPMFFLRFICAITFPSFIMSKAYLTGMSAAFTAIDFTPRIFPTSLLSRLRCGCYTATLKRAKSLFSLPIITLSSKWFSAIFANNINEFVGHNINSTMRYT